MRITIIHFMSLCVYLFIGIIIAARICTAPSIGVCEAPYTSGEKLLIIGTWPIALILYDDRGCAR